MLSHSATTIIRNLLASEVYSLEQELSALKEYYNTVKNKEWFKEKEHAPGIRNDMRRSERRLIKLRKTIREVKDLTYTGVSIEENNSKPNPKPLPWPFNIFNS